MAATTAILAGLAPCLSFTGLDVRDRKELALPGEFFCEISVTGHYKLGGANLGFGARTPKRNREYIQR
jgi:hypothetical protein